MKSLRAIHEHKPIPNAVKESILNLLAEGTRQPGIIRYMYYYDAFNYLRSFADLSELKDIWECEYENNMSIINNLNLIVAETQTLIEQHKIVVKDNMTIDYGSRLFYRINELKAVAAEGAGLLLQALGIAIKNSIIKDADLPKEKSITKEERGNEFYYKKKALENVG